MRLMLFLLLLLCADLALAQERVQVAAGTGGATLASTPTPGNLLVTVAAHRASGSSPPELAGWEVAVVRTADLDNTDLRRGLAVLYKVAGENESRTVNLDWQGGVIQVAEYSGGQDWELTGSASVDTGAGSISPMVVPSVAGGEGTELRLAVAMWRDQSIQTPPTAVTWTDVVDAATSSRLVAAGNANITLSSAYRPAVGPHTARVAWTGAGHEGVAALLTWRLVDPCDVTFCRDITLRWTNPTQYEDGTPLPLEELDNIMVLWAESEDPAAIEGSATNRLLDGAPTETTLTQPAGRLWYGLKALAQGQFSELSNVVAVEVAPGPGAPEVDIWQPPPSGPLTVKAANDGAYVLFQTRNRLELVWVGTVPAGTECDPTQGANGRYRVAVEAVQPPRSTGVVVATCSAD